MTLHDRIMSIATHQKIDGFEASEESRPPMAIRNEAATIAAEADELMVEMADILWSASIGCAVNNKAADAVEKYNNWKERTR